MNYRLAWRARQDVLDIWQYIAKDDEPAADRFVDLLMKHFQLLGTNPYIGRRRDDLREGYRSVPVGQHLILYSVLGSPNAQMRVEIKQVIHGRRDIDTLFV